MVFYIMTNREIEAAETRKNLLKTGLKLIKKYGLENLRVENITAAAGVAKGTFYTHFRRKEDIIYEICRDSFSDIESKFYKDKSGDIIVKLNKFFDNFISEVERFGINVCRDWVRDVVNPVFISEDQDTMKWFFDTRMLIRMLQSEIKDGGLSKKTPVGAFAYIIVSELYGMMLGWCMSDGGFEPRDWTARFCELQIKPMLAPYMTKKVV